MSNQPLSGGDLFTRAGALARRSLRSQAIRWRKIRQRALWQILALGYELGLLRTDLRSSPIRRALR